MRPLPSGVVRAATLGSPRAHRVDPGPGLFHDGAGCTFCRSSGGIPGRTRERDDPLRGRRRVGDLRGGHGGARPPGARGARPARRPERRHAGRDPAGHGAPGRLHRRAGLRRLPLRRQPARVRACEERTLRVAKCAGPRRRARADGDMPQPGASAPRAVRAGCLRAHVPNHRARALRPQAGEPPRPPQSPGRLRNARRPVLTHDSQPEQGGRAEPVVSGRPHPVAVPGLLADPERAVRRAPPAHRADGGEGAEDARRPERPHLGSAKPLLHRAVARPEAGFPPTRRRGPRRGGSRVRHAAPANGLPLPPAGLVPGPARPRAHRRLGFPRGREPLRTRGRQPARRRGVRPPAPLGG